MKIKWVYGKIELERGRTLSPSIFITKTLTEIVMDTSGDNLDSVAWSLTVGVELP